MKHETNEINYKIKIIGKLLKKLVKQSVICRMLYNFLIKYRGATLLLLKVNTDSR